MKEAIITILDRADDRELQFIWRFAISLVKAVARV